MIDLGIIQKQILNLDQNSRSYLKDKEIKELPNVLNDDEKIEKIIRVRLKAHMGGNVEETGEWGLLFATNKRLIFLRKSILGSRFEEFFYNKTDSIHFKAGILYGEMRISVFANEIEFLSVSKKELEPFSNYIREKIAEANKPIEQKSQNYYHYGNVIGTQIQDSLLIRSNIGTITPKCASCGVPINEGQKFCSNCGVEIIPTSSMLSFTNEDDSTELDEIGIDLMEARKYLMEFARKKQMIPYTKFRNDFGLRYTIQIITLLRHISRDCIKRGEPLLSAIVVNEDGSPQKDLFDDATKYYLGYYGPVTGPEANQVHQNELEKISNWNWE